MNRLMIGTSASSYPTGYSCKNHLVEPVARMHDNYVLLKNEIYDLFKEFYRQEDGGHALENSLRSGRSLPTQDFFAQKMRLEVLEEVVLGIGHILLIVLIVRIIKWGVVN